MAQHDYNIANQTGANFRTDLNNALLAISSNNSGSSEPSTMYAYEWWIDTSSNVLKLRNSSNNAWITMPFSITADNTIDINAGTVNGITSLSFSSGSTVTSILDEDNLASDSATALATQQSIKAYVDSQVTAQDLDISDGSSTIAIDLDSETLSLLGGTGVTSAASGNGVTFSIGQSVGTSDNVVFNQVTGALVGNASTATALATARTISGVSFDGTANITLDTDDIGEGSSNKYYTNERVDDQVNTLLTAGANISLTYDDAAGTLTIANTNSADITSVVAGDGLTGGGTSGDVTLTVGVDNSSIEINSDALRVKASGITNAMLGGSIANAKLANSSVTINSQAIALGGSHTFDTDDIGEGSSNLYYTDARANSAIDARVTNTFINNLSGVVADTATALATGRTIGLSGDVTATGVSFDGTGNITLSTTIAANSVALGTDTTGNYVATIADAGNTRITVANSGSESAAITLDIADDAIGTDQLANNAVALGTQSTGNYVATIAGTTNEVDVSGSGSETATVTIGLPDDVTIAGNLTVNGTTTTVNSDTLAVTDPLIKLAKANSGADSLDIGFYGLYDTSGSQDLYAGLFRDANDSGKFKLFKDLQVEPTTTVNTSGTGYAGGTLVATFEGNITGNVTGQVSTLSNHDTDNLSEGSSNLYMTTERVQDIAGGMVTGNTETGITVTYDDSDGTLDFVVGTLNQDTTGNAATATALETARAIALSGDVVGTANFDGTAGISISTTIQANSVALGTDTTGNYVGTITGGTGIDSSGATSGEGIDHTLSIDLNELGTETSIAQDDFVAMVDATDDGSGKITFSNLEDEIFGNISGDINIAAGGAATIQANSVALGTDTTGDYVSTITGGTGITSTGATSGEGIAHSLSVDAAQTQITSVGALDGGSITSGFGSIDVGSSAITTSGTVTGGTLAGTLSTAAQTNITSVGTLTTLTVDDITINASTISDAGDLTLDVGGDIILDADGGDIFFKDDGTQKMQLDGSGRLLIGTDSGDAFNDDAMLRLQRTGDRIFQSFKVDADQEAAIFFGDVDDDVECGIRYQAANKALEFSTGNNSEAMRIDSSGNVGIKTNSPDAQGGNQSTILNIEGSDNIVYLSGGSGGNAIDDGFAIEGVATGVSSGDKRTGSIMMFRENTSTSSLNSQMAFYTTGSGTHAERMRIDSSGKVGIGGTPSVAYVDIKSTNSDKFLHLDDGTNCALTFQKNGTTSFIIQSQGTGFSSWKPLELRANYFELKPNNTLAASITGTTADFTHTQSAHTNGIKIINSQAGGYGSALTFQSERSDDNSIVSAAQIRTQGQDSWNSAASSDSNLFFATALNGSLTDKMVIKHDGSVGIGTTSPDHLLEIETGSTSVAPKLGFRNTQAGTQIGMPANTNALAFYTGDNERLRIDSAGTINPDAVINFVNQYDANVGNGAFIYFSSSGSITIGVTAATSRIPMSFRNPNGEVGTISTSGSSTSFNTSSDYRLKENVNYTWDATTRLKQLKPARFNFIADSDITVDGFLAHEVSSIIPEAITGTKDAVDNDGNAIHQGIDQSKLVPLLVKTIQELEARITALES